MEEELKVALELLVDEKQISKELAVTMLRTDETCEVLTTRFSAPTIFLQEMLALIGKEFVVVGDHYELGNHIGAYNFL